MDVKKVSNFAFLTLEELVPVVCSTVQNVTVTPRHTKQNKRKQSQSAKPSLISNQDKKKTHTHIHTAPTCSPDLPGRLSDHRRRHAPRSSTT
jgi:hypothetical protein